MRLDRAFHWILVLGLLLPLVGCGSSSTPGGPTTLVTGKVLWKGRPVTKGTVSFEPEGAGKEAFGEIQSDGTYVLTTYKKDDGAVFGKHRVSISNAGKSAPLKYANYQSSQIEVEVAEGKSDYSINLN